MRFARKSQYNLLENTVIRVSRPSSLPLAILQMESVANFGSANLAEAKLRTTPATFGILTPAAASSVKRGCKVAKLS